MAAQGSIFSKMFNSLFSIFQSTSSVPTTGDIGFNRGLFQQILNWPKTLIPNQSGQLLDATTALQVSIFYACVTKISKDIAKLPIIIQKKTIDPAGRAVNENAPRHYLTRLLNDRPSTFDMTLPLTYHETLFGWALRYQAGYSFIERDDTGTPVSLDLIHPTRVRLEIDPITRVINYIVNNSSNGEAWFPENLIKIREEDMFVLHNFGDGRTGIPITDVAAEALGIAKAGQQYTATFFGNGLKIDSILKTPQMLKPDAKRELKEQWKEEFSGINSHNMAVLDRDLEWMSINVKSSDAELLESRKFQISEIARYFDMPLHKVQEMIGATFKNVENLNIDYVTDTLGSWMARYLQEMKMKLLPARSPFFGAFDIWPLIKGDLDAQGDFFGKMLGGGSTPAVMTVNEVRARLSLNPHPDGDELMQPLNTADTDLARQNQLMDIALKEKQLNEPTIVPGADPETPGASSSKQPQDDGTDEPVSGIVDEPAEQQLTIDIISYRPVLMATIERLIHKEQKFLSFNRDIKPEEYLRKSRNFYRGHQEHMAENLEAHKLYLNSEIDLPGLSKEACEMDKTDDNWPLQVSTFICNSLIASMQDRPEQLQTLVDGQYADPDTGELYMVENGIARKTQECELV